MCSVSDVELVPRSRYIRHNHFLFMSYNIRCAFSRGSYINAVVLVLREKIKCVSWSLNRRYIHASCLLVGAGADLDWLILVFYEKKTLLTN